MNEDWDELRAAAKREADKAPPLSPRQSAAIASAFRGSQSPWRTEKLRGKK